MRDSPSSLLTARRGGWEHRVSLVDVAKKIDLPKSMVSGLLPMLNLLTAWYTLPEDDEG